MSILKIKDENDNFIEVPALRGEKGEDGVGIKSVTQTTISSADDGNNVITVTKTDNTTSTFTVKNGSKGSAGDQGFSILRVTTALSSYTTTVGGFTPKYRIALSTVLSQSGASKVRVGDTILRNYYTYSVGYVDSSYVYVGDYASIRGSAGTSVTISSVTESEESGGENVVTFSDAKTLTIKNGVDGRDGENGYTPVKGTDYFTEADKSEFIAEVKTVCVAQNQGSENVGKILVVGTDGNLTLIDMPEGGASGDVTGVLDESNNILLSGNLADGTYTLKYENEDGTYTEIGTLEVGQIPEPEPVKTNFFNIGGDGYLHNGRCGSDGGDRSGADQNYSGCLSNYFEVANGDTIYVENATISNTLNSGIKLTDNTIKAYIPSSSDLVTNYSESDGVTQFTINSETIAYTRLCLAIGTSFSISNPATAEDIENANIIINIKRNGEWL